MKHSQLLEEDSNAELLKKNNDGINLTRDGKSVDITLSNNLQQEKKKRIIKYTVIGAIVTIVLVLAIVLPIVLTKKDNPPSPPIPPQPPVDHYNPYVVKDADVKKQTFGLQGKINFNEQLGSSDHQDQLTRILSNEEGDDEPKKLGVQTKQIPRGVNNNVIKQLSFSFGQVTWKVGHFMLTDGDDTKSRFSVPEMAVPKPKVDQSMRLDMIGMNVNTNGAFYFQIVDPNDNKNVYVDTKGQSLLFMDKYIQMDMLLPSQRIFGLGERVREFQLTEGTWTMWASGQNSAYDDGTGRKGAYGVHPFMLVQGAKKDDFFGMYFRNANAQSPIIRYTKEGKSILSYITLGGQIEIYFFVHGTAKDIINAYQNYFGKPYLPPFWSLGWQQASYAYDTQDKVDKVVKAYAEQGFPLDAVYLDIPYMDNFLDFTVDTAKFPKLKEFTEGLHKNNQHMVVIIDAGIGAEDTTNTYYKLGNDNDVFIKSGIWKSEKYNNNLLLQVWQKKTVFVDWFNDKCMNLWSVGLKDLFDKVPYDGIWIDMNEPTGFMDGEEKPVDGKTIKNEKLESSRCKFLIINNTIIVLKEDDENFDFGWYKSFDQGIENTFDLPFVPRYDQADEEGHKQFGNFDNQTISLNATHPGLNNEKEYNLHSLYGHMMANRTNFHLTTDEVQKTKRPFVLTRSSFTSTGKYASHWLGDNFRSWDYLKYSIPGIMNMNMFGISHAGPDICGFFGTKRDDELCARWTQLATFYPLARFHYVDKSDPNEPFLMEGKWKDIAKKSMQDRYQYLRHLYTCMYEANLNGGSCYDPLFYYFPTDENVYGTYIDTTVMVGGAIKVTPILEEIKDDQKDFEAYFPKGVWVDLNNPKNVIDTRAKGGDTVKLSTENLSVHTHLKSGSMIAFQDNSDGKVMTTTDLLKKPISLYAVRDDNGYAYGSLFLDQGISAVELKEKQIEYYQLHLQSNSIQNMLYEGSRGTQNHILDSVKIFNAGDLEKVNFACYLDMNKKPVSMLKSFDAVSNTFTLSVEQPGTLKFNQFHSIHFGDSTKGDLNLCDPQTFAYKIPQGQVIDLTQPSAIIQLEHMAGTLPDIELSMRILETKDIINIKWTFAKDKDGNYPPVGKREPREVPDEFITTGHIKLDLQKALKDYVKISTEGAFQITFINKEDPAGPYFSITGMLFDDYLNWINVKVTSQDPDFKGVFGLGERATEDIFMKDGVYSMWARDSLTPDENGKPPGNNMYGTHPFFMYKYKSNNWVGVLYKLANAQDWWIKNNVDAKTVDISTVATGGVADIYIMVGTKPDAVIQTYFELIGTPVLTPQWSLGWNQCRWGYVNTQMLKDVVAGYAENDLPLDVQWSDIDYMNLYRSFEYDHQAFADLPAFVDDLHNNKKMKWVPILDAGLSRRDGGDYEAYNEGLKIDAFMKVNGQIMTGEVWPNDAVYPDFFNPKITDWYHKYLSKLWNQVKFDGLWEDMNEAANFCNGICYPSQKPAQPVKQKLKYIPSSRDLEFKSMSLDATHANGYLQLDTHSYYGTQMVKSTHEWFAAQDRRTFIIERSSFAGMGKYGSRWLGDNFSEDKSMAYSVSGIMLMNMFGITLSGSDICGFIGNTTDELCTKWHVVGSFYPFSRNHNNWGQTPQEPYLYKGKTIGEDKKDILGIMRDSIKRKYSLIRYYYTQMFLVSTQNIGTFFKPVFFEFPDDPKAFNEQIYNVMLGDSLKLSINPRQLKLAQKDYYFPAGVWCGISGTDNADGILGKCISSPKGQTITYPAQAWDYQLHIRQGKIVPLQTDVMTKKFSTSVEIQSWPVDLHVLGAVDLNNNWSAEGTYVNDDGVTLKYQGKFNQYLFRAVSAPSLSFKVDQVAKNTGKGSVDNCNDVNTNDFLQSIYFYNSKSLLLNQAYTVQAIMVSNATPTDIGKASYDSVTDRLVFTAEKVICLTDLKELKFTKSQ